MPTLAGFRGGSSFLDDYAGKGHGQRSDTSINDPPQGPTVRILTKEPNRKGPAAGDDRC